MKNVIAARLPRLARRGSIHLVLALVLAIFFVACGDDSSSSVSPEPASENQSSSSKGFKNSSSSVDKNSSSSEQGNSSVSGKNSSSSVVESSSSEFVFHICDEGDTAIFDRGDLVFATCRNGRWDTDSIISSHIRDSLAAIEKNKEHPSLDSLFAGYSGEYLEFEDPRDGHKYKYVKFIWHSEDGKGRDTFYVMAENLNYGKMVLGGTTEFDDNVTEKLCYDDDEWFCDNHFGGLYTWAEAMNLPKVCDSVAVDSNDACKSFADAVKIVSDPRVVRWQGICPDGWHIMNQYEWEHTTETSAGLKSKAVWTEKAGLNSFGMSIIPTGEFFNGGAFSGVHERISLWLPNELNYKKSRILYMSSDSYSFKTDMYSNEKSVFSPVRCVMDANNTLTH